MERLVALNSKEQKKVIVINKVKGREVGGRDVAALLGISLRHLRRLIAGYMKYGVRA